MAEAAVPEVSLSTGSEAAFDIECAPCGEEGQHKEAESYCRDCGVNLCRDCVRDHKKVPSLKRHKLMDKDAMTDTQGNPQVWDTCTEKCPDHKSEIIKFFCPDHRVTACVACVALNHKPCEDLEYIEEAAAGLEDRQDYMEFTASLDDLTQQSEDTVTQALESKQRSSDCHAKIVQDLEAYEEELVITVQRHMEAIRDQAGQIHAQDEVKMDKLASQGNKMLTELRAVATNVNDSKTKKHFCKLFVEMKQREQMFRGLRGNLERMGGEKVTAYSFQPGEDLRAMIGRQDDLGKLVITGTERSTSTTTGSSGKPPSQHTSSTPDAKTNVSQPLSNQGGGLPDAKSKASRASSKQVAGTPGAKSKTGQPSSQQAVNTPARDVKKMRASHVTDINVRRDNDTTQHSDIKECWIHGMAVVASDKVVVADFNNGTVKLIDTTNNTLLSEYKPNGVPWDVTTYKDTIAATTTGHIEFLKHARGLVHDRTISVDGCCKGIDHYDGKLFVIFDNEKKLEVMTPEGVVLQTFSTTAQGEQLFQEPQYVTVSVANQRIYVSDGGSDRVVVLGMDGNQTGTYEDSELGRPRQLAVDKTGVMFLCDSGYKIHLLSSAGRKVKILLTGQDGVDNWPYSICYCEATGRLFVGMFECDNIKVYKIS